ncbi:gamma-glutamyltransferase family protein [Planctomycetota bacterium]
MKTLCLLVTSLLLIFVVSYSVFAEEISWNASGTGGAVAAAKKESVEAGLTILKQGGNAADAAAATLLALSITETGFFVIGSEVPLIIYDAKKKEVKVLNGLGGAPLDKEAIDWYNKNGIPGGGGMKSAPVPGAMSLIMKLLQLYGTMSFEQASAPALALLETGERMWDEMREKYWENNWHPALAKTFRKLIETEKKTVGTREEKLQAARDRYYKGDIADALEAFYIKEGGFLRKKDLIAHETRLEDPVTINYRGYDVYKCDTWTQGPFLCQTLRILEGFDLKKMGYMSADYIHVLTEAMKLGFADRDEYYGDPLYEDVPMKELLSDEYTELRRPLIDMKKASATVRPGDPFNMKAVKKPSFYQPGIGGTTTCTVADKWGNMVVATPSGNPPYSIDPVTGIPHGNRLRQLNTTPRHPNRMEPGKRPRMTLTPTMVLKDGKAVIAISVAGGDTQDQTALICLLNFIEFGILPKESVMAPRFSTGHHEGSFSPNVNRGKTLGNVLGLGIENVVDEEVIAELTKRGHKVRTFSGANSHPIMLYVDPYTGKMYAAGDHRVWRHAGVVNSIVLDTEPPW